LNLPNFHLALEDNAGAISGYALAFPSDAPYDGEEFGTLRKRLSDPFIYIDQVAVAPNMRRNGIASSLYLALEREAESQAVSVLCCEVNLEPPNPTSLAFHLARGFQQLGELATEDGRRVALMSRQLA
jgi:predicted GNAT superfamily acetyltransferase